MVLHGTAVQVLSSFDGVSRSLLGAIVTTHTATLKKLSPMPYCQLALSK